MIRALLILALTSAPAFAHSEHAHSMDVGTTWTWDAWVTLPLGLSGILYAIGTGRLWHHAGLGRGVRYWQALSFALGWSLLAGALVSPLHWLGERLFTAHMIEHEILMVLAAPMLVVARPIGAMLWALPTHARRSVGRIGRVPALSRLWSWLVDPLVATVLHGMALWIWHVPLFYEAALATGFVHWLQHLSFLVTALLFWWALVRGRARERGYGAAVFYLFATALHSGFLGILLAIARAPLVPRQGAAAAEWGLTALEDQQLAGVIMWVPAGLVYAVAALILAGIWITHAGSLAPRNVAHVTGQ